MEAMDASAEVFEPAWGQISTDHVQLCPQNRGMLDEQACSNLMTKYRNTRFRLHANARVLNRHYFLDLSRFNAKDDYWKQLASISKMLHAEGYTAHSGFNQHSPLKVIFDNTRRAADLFECKVGVEGLYPSKHEDHALSTWDEYKTLLGAKVHYAIDLSHLNIVARKERVYHKSLVKELLSSEWCMELHVSDNNGMGDQHRIVHELPYWAEDIQYLHPDAVIFTEGMQPTNNPQ